MSKLIDVRKDYIINESKNLFLKKGIESVLIKDIAYKTNVGEATIYRYFKKKDNLVIQAAISIQNEILPKYFNFNKEKSGIELIKDYYEIFLKIFNDHQNYYTFLKELDVYILRNDIKELEEYELGIKNFGLIYKEMVNKGLSDNTLKKDLDYETFFYSSTHALLGICEKLALGKAIIKQDEKQKKNEEIEILINSFINFIKN